MTCHIRRLVSSLVFITVLVPAIASAQEPTAEVTLIRTMEFSEQLRGEDRLIHVPENRHDTNSRKIAVHYMRIPAQAETNLPPVVILPGGPGHAIVSDDVARGLVRTQYNLSSEIAAYSAHRDVLIVNQRGVAGTPGGPALPKYWLAGPPQDLSKPLSFEDSADRLAQGLRRSIRRCERLGFDLRGYDLSHLVDDVDAIRQAHGYQQLALRGASFGSQWALAYLNRYPSNVDRMLLSGVEPVDYGYDSADGLWNVIERVASEACQSDDAVLDIGLPEAVKAIVERLENQPVQVRGVHPRKNYSVDVQIGADDFRHYLLQPVLDSRRHSRRMFDFWPKFVAEVYSGDYRYLAARIIDDRPETTPYGLLFTLVDNSIGVSSDRERRLDEEPARQWLGDVNWLYRGTRHVCSTGSSGAELRPMRESPVPLLMVHGTLDLATPLENAVDLIQFFPHAKLLTVTGGTHAATHHAASADKEFLRYLVTFMNSDDPVSEFASIPSEIKLQPLDFEKTSGKSLFEMLIESPEENGRTTR